MLHPGVEPGLIACKATVLTATPMEPLPGTQIPSPKADRALRLFSLFSTPMSNYKGQGMDALAKVPLGGAAKKSHAKKAPHDAQAKIDALKRLCKARDNTIEDLKSQIGEHQRQNQWLFKQITEMTRFLEDYGLHWVGGPAPEFASFPSGPLDMELFNNRIADLNRLADSTSARIRASGNIQRLQHAPVMALVLLDTGFTVNGGELRPYAEKRNGMFIQDIVDGFFPGEFKDRYPDGVKFTVEDRRSEELFKGTARRLIESARGIRRDEEEVCDGDGKLKVKMANGGDVVIPISAATKVRQVRRIVQKKMDMDEFELCLPLSTNPVEDTATMGSLGLYPRGVLVVKFGMNSGPIKPVRL